MTDKKAQTKAGATELKEEELEQAQGGFTAPGDVAGVKLSKKAGKVQPKSTNFSFGVE